MAQEVLRFPALRHRNFRVLWLGMLFASGTMAFQYYAQMWLVYSVTRSAWILGILGAIRGLATLMFGLFGGVLADRMNRRVLLLFTGSVGFVISISLGLVALSGHGSVWIVFLLIFIGAAAGSIDAPVRQALIPELVPAQHIPNAVALTSAAQMGSFAITPVLAGFVIDALGPGGAYLISGIGNIAILVALVMLRYQRTVVAAGVSSVFASLRVGVAFCRRHRVLVWIIVLNFTTAALCFSLFMGLIAKWAGAVLGLTPGQYGMLAATWGVGTLAASYTLSWMGEITRPGRIVVVGAFLFSFSFAVFGFARSLPLVGLIYLVNGAAWTASNIASTAIIQRMVPNEVRGRVMSVFMLNSAFAQMNSLLLGVIADTFSMQVMVPFAAGLSTLLVIVMVAAVPTLRHLDQVVGEYGEPDQLPAR